MSKLKKLHFDYCMEISYSVAVSKCYYTIKCIPKDTARQKISNLSIEMTPPSKAEWSYDSMGNRYIWGSNSSPHSYFQFRVTGNAECKDVDYEDVATENECMIFRHGTRLTIAGERIQSYYGKLKAMSDSFDEMTTLERAKFFMNALHQDFKYSKGITGVHTTAEEAYSLGNGVCQDYAHILISLLLLSGYSARYVTGLITGEGESHAWVEVEDHGKWYGLDPTNNVMVGDNHIKIGVGRDAMECQINRGIMHGGGDQTQNISVAVSEISRGQKYLSKGAFF